MQCPIIVLDTTGATSYRCVHAVCCTSHDVCVQLLVVQEDKGLGAERYPTCADAHRPTHTKSGVYRHCCCTKKNGIVRPVEHSMLAFRELRRHVGSHQQTKLKKAQYSLPLYLFSPLLLKRLLMGFCIMIWRVP